MTADHRELAEPFLAMLNGVIRALDLGGRERRP